LLAALPAAKLAVVRRFSPCLPFVLFLGALVGCAAANGGSLGTGGSGAIPSEQQSEHTLSCTIGDLVLEIPVELRYSPDGPLIAGAKVDLGFSATVLFDEVFSAAIIDAGVSKIDIMSIDVSSSVLGATPTRLETSLVAGINDFDLAVDTDDNGAPGPHRVDLQSITTTVTVDGDADELELGLGLDGLFLMMGDFEVPTDCVDPTLVGFAVRFEVVPPG
jgi:hypothetical protein